MYNRQLRQQRDDQYWGCVAGTATLVALVGLLLFAYIGYPAYCYHECHKNVYTCLVERHVTPRTVLLANGQSIVDGFTFYYTARTIDRNPELHTGHLSYIPYTDAPNMTKPCYVFRNTLSLSCSHCFPES